LRTHITENGIKTTPIAIRKILQMELNRGLSRIPDHHNAKKINDADDAKNSTTAMPNSFTWIAVTAAPKQKAAAIQSFARIRCQAGSAGLKGALKACQ
jgi:hypothetical protein